jgi:hypothetical protein
MLRWSFAASGDVFLSQLLRDELPLEALRWLMLLGYNVMYIIGGRPSRVMGLLLRHLLWPNRSMDNMWF